MPDSLPVEITENLGRGVAQKKKSRGTPNAPESMGREAGVSCERWVKVLTGKKKEE